MPHDSLCLRPRAALPHLRALAAAGAALAAALCAAPAWSAPPVYTIVELPLLKGDPTEMGSLGSSINKNGDIAGTITQYVSRRRQASLNSYGVIWPADGSAPIKLKAPQPERPNDNVITWGINKSRSVSGMSVDYYGRGHFPERWIDRKVLALQTPGFGQALAIGEDNVTVGFTQVLEDQAAYPTVWAADGTPRQIGTTPGFIGAINASSHLMGWNNDGPFVSDAAGSNFVYLRQLPGQTRTSATYPWAMNDNNEVVGTCDKPSANAIGQVACLWSADGTPMELGQFNDNNLPYRYVAWGLNNSRQVTGYYFWMDPNDGFYYVTYTYWSPETGLVDILSLIDPADPLLADAKKSGLNIRAIGDDGVIVGQIGLSRAVKLVPRK